MLFCFEPDFYFNPIFSNKFIVFKAVFFKTNKIFGLNSNSKIVQNFKDQALIDYVHDHITV